MRLGCVLLVMAFNITIGALATNYIVEHWFHKSISLILAALIGLVGAQVIVPLAIVTWLLTLGGVI